MPASESHSEAAAREEHEAEWEALDRYLRHKAALQHIGGQSGAAEEAWQRDRERIREWADMVKRLRESETRLERDLAAANALLAALGGGKP